MIIYEYLHYNVSSEGSLFLYVIKCYSIRLFSKMNVITGGWFSWRGDDILLFDKISFNNFEFHML